MLGLHAFYLSFFEIFGNETTSLGAINRLFRLYRLTESPLDATIQSANEREAIALTEEQWRAIELNDASYDGLFYYGVKTTRNVCRPSCPARRCRRDHAIAFDTLEEALSAGYRPCSRCRPDRPDWRGARAELAENAKKWIDERYTEKFTLQRLAQHLFVNASYLNRVFHESVGVTPLAYHNAARIREACRLLRESDLPITQISWKTGFSTTSHFSKVFHKLRGMTPTEYRKQANTGK